ncbi:sugar phosphate nucleotidyltransferase [Streptomyces sp. NPDC059474]|uniref:sugar phosphate nucleotidyltransferase n=1 Tax=Streptomyces sp. NPDC059474 TaxID=3346846 RepID=UPI00367AB564
MRRILTPPSHHRESDPALLRSPQRCPSNSCRLLPARRWLPWGLELVYAEEFIGEWSVALILGDNNLHGAGLGTQLRNRIRAQSARVFAYPVSGPRTYGVVDFDEDGKVRSGEEKPAKPKSRYAVPGRISTTIESWRSLRN